MLVSDSPYEMHAELSALKHLGIGRYSNVPAVLAEAVANAWDADATRVSIQTGFENKDITISDDGHGMSVQDVNEKYLRVGYERRKTGAKTPRFNRDVMGRKGIGKLSLFSIADTVTVHTVKDGQSHAFEMDVEDMKSAFNAETPTYRPRPVSPDPGLKKGTLIVLTGIKHQLYHKSTRKKLARRFAIGPDASFTIEFDGKPITAEDRDYKNVQYAWVLGERGREAVSRSQSGQVAELPSEVRIRDGTERIDGWIGTVKTPRQLMDSETGETANKIAIMVRNKMAQDDVLGSFEEAGVYSKYLVGEIHADFLDEDGKDDIMTTGRQLIKEDDRRYAALKEKIWHDLKTIQGAWTDLRNEDGTRAACAIPQIEAWYDGLRDDHRSAAKRLFGRINQFPIDDDGVRKEMLVGGILAFENLKLKDMIGKLEKIDVGNLPDLKDALLQLDDLEATAYYQTISKRLKVIKAFENIVDDNAKEKIIQEYMFDHLWVLDPSWERVAGTERMEKSVENALGAAYAKVPEEQKRSRIDIKYRTTGGKHVIIELKRPGASTSTSGLVEQIGKYESAVSGALASLGRPGEPVEFVCVLGRPPKDWQDRDGEKKSRDALAAYGARIVMYDELVENAQKAYQEYIEKQKNVTRVFELIQSISWERPPA